MRCIGNALKEGWVVLINVYYIFGRTLMRRRRRRVTLFVCWSEPVNQFIGRNVINDVELLTQAARLPFIYSECEGQTV